ncbi:hypothetical protein [Nocardia transvalensis]|uniref:hypothetical protein n=1 Tax=Nocardia transvalensis TaxID=37333 RepID=UPI001893976D|nr:hypothetical protein [Nocardia transvalensis]MBF6333515.1 hypothetical protein [Nocardia transvalensis]
MDLHVTFGWTGMLRHAILVQAPAPWMMPHRREITIDEAVQVLDNPSGAWLDAVG